MLTNGWMVSSTGSIISGLATSQEQSSRHDCTQSRGLPAPIADTPLSAPNETQRQPTFPSFSSIPPELRPVRRSLLDSSENSLTHVQFLSFLSPQLQSQGRSCEVTHFPDVMTHADIESGQLRSYSREDDPVLPHHPSFSFLPPDLRPVREEDSTMEENEDHAIDVGSETGSMRNDRRRKYRNHGRVLDFLLLVGVTIGVGVAIGVGVGVSQKNKNDSSDNITHPSTIPMQCNYTGIEANGSIPNAFVQCFCDGNVTKWTEDILTRSTELRDTFILTVLPNFDEEEQSCDHTNTAL